MRKSLTSLAASSLVLLAGMGTAQAQINYQSIPASGEDGRPYTVTINEQCVREAAAFSPGAPQWELRQQCEVRTYSSTPVSGVASAQGIVPGSTPRPRPVAVQAASSGPIEEPPQSSSAYYASFGAPSPSSLSSSQAASANRPYSVTINADCMREAASFNPAAPQWELRQQCEVRTYSSTPVSGVANVYGVVPSGAGGAGSTSSYATAAQVVPSPSASFLRGADQPPLVTYSYLPSGSAPSGVDNRPYQLLVNADCVRETRANDPSAPDWQVRQSCETRVYSSTPSTGVANANGVIPCAAQSGRLGDDPRTYSGFPLGVERLMETNCAAPAQPIRVPTTAVLPVGKVNVQGALRQ